MESTHTIAEYLEQDGLPLDMILSECLNDTQKKLATILLNSSILTGPDNELLRQKAIPVGLDEESLYINALLANKMIDVCDAFSLIGVIVYGLAAPQIGINKRLVVAKLPSKGSMMIFKSTISLQEAKTYFNDNEYIVMLNPEIISQSEETQEVDDFCLSLPGIAGHVSRPKTLVVRFNDLHGNLFEIKMIGMNAAIVSHEIDHLNGVLYTDKANYLCTVCNETKQMQDPISKERLQQMGANMRFNFQT